MNDGLIVVKQAVLNIVQTIRVICRGVNLQARRVERSSVRISAGRLRSRTSLPTPSPGTKRGELQQQLPGSSAGLKTASALLLLSGHFCKTSLWLHSWKSCSLLCWALVDPQGVSETLHTSQPVGIKRYHQANHHWESNLRMIACDYPAASFCCF